jgi:hypothetical protein
MQVREPPPDAVTLYPVTAEPPSLAGADHDTSTEVSPATPVTFVGAPGKPNGVTAADATEAGESPRAFVAFTVKV